MSDIPTWAMELLADLLDEEDVHPKLLAEMYDHDAGKHVLKPYPWCANVVLAKVPADVLRLAQGWARHRATMAARDESQ